MLAEIVSLSVISLLGAMSPGPDFAIITRHALTGSRKSAILASLGVCLAIMVHVTYCSLGVAFLLSKTPLLFKSIQVAGACYLGYLGAKLLFSKKSHSAVYAPPLHKAFLSGFLTNLLNPKATLFVLSVFTQFVNPSTPLFIEFVYGFVIAGVGFAWFASLSYIITHRALRNHFVKFQTILMKVMGFVLLALGISVLFTISIF
ncbi:MAG: LysE family transporter [Chlamydiae bacterium]|nr:LysE family transporter [Chlamydiota bacterium]